MNLIYVVIEGLFVNDGVIIESTSGDYKQYGGIIHFTTKQRTLDLLSDWGKPWVIGRLIVGE